MKFKTNRVVAILAILAIVIAFCVYMFSYKIDFIKALYHSFTIYSLDIKKPSDFGVEEPKFWTLIYVAGLLAIYVLYQTIIGLYIKFFRHDSRLQRIIRKGKHIIVIGLGESNRVYIDSELMNNNKDIIIIEPDKNNPYIEKYKEKIGVIIGDGQDITILENINYSNAKHIVISTANDMVNLEIAIQVLTLDTKKKMFVHIEDRSLRHFHKKNGILSGESVKIYSYYEDTARELFSEYDIDGIGDSIIQSNDSYSIVIVGNSILSYEIIAQACIMGQLPNENKLTIYCIDKNVKKFEEDVNLHFPKILKIHNLIFKYIDLDVNSKMFYTHSIWNRTITNIILCFEQDQKNLDIAANLLNITFSSRISDKIMKTNILFAMFNNTNLNNLIKDNLKIFKYLYPFGNINDINESEYVISSQRDEIAIATNYIYNNIGVQLENYDEYKYRYSLYLENNKYKNKLSIRQKIKKEKNDLLIKVYNNSGFIETNDINWLNLSYFKKESNRAVADQMKMKLKYLGLKIVKSNEKNMVILFKNNRKFFNLTKEEKFLLARMEHNRWNAFHYMHGYKKINFVSKKEKVALEEVHEIRKNHMCLVKFSKFRKRKKELESLGYKSGIFEGYDFMINAHIPLILANAGYAIKKSIKFGVTGHRKYKFKNYINKIIENELEKLSIKYEFDEIISPLADGADRVIVKLLMDQYNSKVIALLPFEKNEYKKDFLEDSQKEFDSYLEQAFDFYEIGSLEENSREECYLKVGKEVVDKSDILIAIWDGKEADGINKIGGTAYVVDYAKEQEKPIIHINTETLKVEWFFRKNITT